MAEAELALPLEIAFVDLETTGGNAVHDRITEVGVVRVSGGEIVDEWSSFVQPDRPIPAFITQITGISDAMVANAPRFSDLAATIREKIGGAVFVAHNANFDYGFVCNEFRRMEQTFTAEVLCTVKLSRRLFPAERRHSLDAVIARHEIRCQARHRALGDARVLWDFWQILRAAKPRDLARATEALIGANRRAARGADLGVLLAKPRRAAAPPAAVTIRWAAEAGPNGAANLSLAPLGELSCDDFDRCFGLFGSAKSAEKALRAIADARQLCAKMLGLELGPGPCIAFALDRCRGACVGKEPASLHAMRLQLALTAHKLKSWPFPHRIAIRQLRDDAALGGTELHVLDRWRYLGTARNDAELAELSQVRAPVGLDPDIYRLLSRYLGRARKIDWIDLARQRASAKNFDV